MQRRNAEVSLTYHVIVATLEEHKLLLTHSLSDKMEEDVYQC